MPFKKVIDALEELNDRFAPLLESVEKPAKGKKKAKPVDDEDETEESDDEDEEEVPAAKKAGKKKAKASDDDEESEEDDEAEETEESDDDEEEAPAKKKGAKDPTLDDVKAALRDVKSAINQDEAKSILKKAGKSSDIMKVKKELYGAVIKACAKAVEASGDNDDEETEEDDE